MDTFLKMQIQTPQHYSVKDEKGLGANGERKKLWCNQCLYGTDRRNNLTRHMKTMHGECSQSLECCFITFPCKAAFRAHVRFYHQHGYSCPMCPRVFCRKALLKRHLCVHNGYKEFTCPHCDYATSHKSNLQRHTKVHFNNKPTNNDPSSEVPLSIPKRDEPDEFERRRQRRPTWRMAQLPYKCPVCGERYPNQESLRGHVYGKHPVQDAGSLSIVNLLTSMARARYCPLVRNNGHQWAEPYRKEHLQNYLCHVSNGNPY